MISFFKKPIVIALLILVAANIALFWKFYFKGLLPFPGDLLVSFYFPWSSGGFAGFDSWTTRKDVIAMDVIRQMYPWKTLATNLIKSGNFPLWNPYNFSGTPLLANVQSSILFPGMVLFLVLPYLWAWLGHVIFLPLFFGLFVYIYLRSLKLSNWSAIFGALVASNISSLTVWAEQIVLIQSALFSPLVLWAIERKRFWLVPIFLAFSIFGGHPQTIAYVFLISFGYLIFKKVPIRWFFVIGIFSLALAAIQLVPSAELYWNSAREVPASRELFFASALPWQNLLTTVVPDIFGNPATNNYVGRDYGNFQTYFGIVALILSIVALMRVKTDSHIRFFGFMALFGLIFSLPPFAFVFSWLKVPILSSGYPSRMIFVFQFSMAMLAAFGLEHVLSLRGKIDEKIYFSLGVVGLAILAIVGLVLSHKFNLPVTRNYLMLLIGVFAVIAAAIKFSRLRFLLLTIAIFEYAYFFNKYQPFAPAKFVFPEHPIFGYLQNNAEANRFMGFDRAYVDNNFATYYKVYSPEGYDPLYIKRYEEFLAGAKNSTLEKDLPRSDAWVKTDNNKYRDRLLDILGVKYIIDKTDDPKKEWEPDLNRFPKEEYEMVWRVNKWKIFSRRSVLPRAFLAGQYIVEPKDIHIVEKFYDQNFDYRNVLILEKNINTTLDVATGSAKIVEYSPNKVIIQTKSLGPKLLFLSDVYYPGWKVTVNGQPTEVLRADYTFRAVLVPGGESRVEYFYEPISFKIGLDISLISGLILLAFLGRKK